MAGFWIKMRSDLLRSPHVVQMSRSLIRSEAFRSWLCPDGGKGLSEEALRCVTCALLMRVWSDARSFGKFGESGDGDDLIVADFNVPDIDLWACAPGVGKAMVETGWVRSLDSDGEHNGLLFPNFRQYNAPMEPAEKQAAYHKRKRKTSRDGVTKALPMSGNAVLPQEKIRERREEKNNTPVVPKGTLGRKSSDYSEHFERWWKIYPRGEGKATAYKAWVEAGKALVASKISPRSSEEAVAYLLERVTAYAASPRALLSDPSKLPMASTWLNQGRYDDKPATWQIPLTSNNAVHHEPMEAPYKEY